VCRWLLLHFARIVCRVLVTLRERNLSTRKFKLELGNLLLTVPRRNVLRSNCTNSMHSLPCWFGITCCRRYVPSNLCALPTRTICLSARDIAVLVVPGRDLREYRRIHRVFRVSRRFHNLELRGVIFGCLHSSLMLRM
jgi:hypothetical protein